MEDVKKINVFDQINEREKAIKATNMTFLEMCQKAVRDEIEFEAIIAEEYMPATFCFDDSIIFTDYCMKKYGDLLNSQCVYTPAEGNRGAEVEVFYENEKKGEEFAYELAGYGSAKEYEKLFQATKE